jgi:hypothetical protein
VVLIFTVAVLVLLALIATAYLATSRIDRVYVDVKGGAIGQGSAIGGGGGDDLPGAVLEDLRRDVFDWAQGPGVGPTEEAKWYYRLPIEPADPSVVTTYRNWDYLFELPGTAGGFAGATTAENAASYALRTRYDPWLASRTPLAYNGAGAFTEAGGAGLPPAWPVISRWVERWNDGAWVFPAPPNVDNKGYFESPIANGGAVTYTTRHAAIPTWVRIDYPNTFVAPKRMQGQSRVYPALRFDVGPDAGRTYLAGDTDGDGVADAGLFPLNGLPQFPDGALPAGFYAGELPPAAHTTRWYAAIRVVDNTGVINVNTAWRRDVDINLEAGGYSDAAATGAPAGAMANYAFFRSNIGLYELLDPVGSPGSDLTQEWDAFTLYRHGGATGVTTATGRNDYIYSSFAEALEMNLARRPFAPGSSGSTTFRGFDASLTANLAFLNGLINPTQAPTLLEQKLYRDAYRNAPNWAALDFVTESEKAQRSFTFYVGPQDAKIATATPAFPADSPLLWWHSIYNPNAADRMAYLGGIGFTNPPARPVRHLLTTANPLSTGARPTESAPSPTWLNVGSPSTVAMTKFPGGYKTQGAINTDPFESLWRDFYQTMADPTNSSLAQDPAELNVVGNRQTLTPAETLQVRAALAAINAVDMRDGDDDITTRRIRPSTTSTVDVMVAGCEKQLFISQVTGGGPFQVTLHNPYTTPINATGYRLAILPAGGGGYTNPIALTETTILAGTDSVQVNLAIDGVTDGDIVLLRTRRAVPVTGTPEKSVLATNKYDESNLQDLVPVDIVRVGALPSGVTNYARSKTNWLIASSGNGMGSPGTTPNPFGLDAMPGTNKAVSTTNNRFPFGGFGRNGDMMLIPYVGSYVFYPTASNTIVNDVTPITFDVERVTTTPATGQIKGRFTPAPAGPSGDWRSRIFDNFAALANPKNDYTPNMAPESWLGGKNVMNPNVKNANTPTPVVGNDPDVPDATSPVHGLINVNTASREVLRMVPFVADTGNGMIDPTPGGPNDDVVDAILAQRRTGGPFKSVADLINRVPGFSASMTPNPMTGHFMTDSSPVITDYANTYHSFIRVSNLLTTRSDAFTMYVLLQQWQDFGTAQPVLLNESRYAAVIDRSQLSDVDRTGAKIKLESVATE